MRFLGALVLYCLCFSAAARASGGKTYVHAKQQVRTSVSVSAIQYKVPTKNHSELSKAFYEHLDLIQQYPNFTILACCKGTPVLQFSNFAVQDELPSPFGIKSKFYEQYILGCLYPKHTFW